MVGKEILGGIFRWPDLREIQKRVRGKFGYLPKDDSLEIPESYSPNPIRDPLFVPPRIYIMRRLGFV